MIAPLPRNEAAWMDWLDQSGVLDTPAEKAFDDITRPASQVCGAPIAAITLLDRERRWFKSILGLPIKEPPRDLSFCAHTVFQPEVVVVPDARSDERFAARPFVKGEPHVRFYADAPPVTSEGFALGTLCVLDRVPRALSAEKAVLEMLARQVVGRIGRIRQAIKAAPWPTRPVTASLGVAPLGPGMDGGTLVECADRATYRSKPGGRNRVTPAAAPAPDEA
jgi:hypothetical protein